MPLSFPYTRLRRNRKAAWSRDIISETKLMPSDMILPIFIHDEECKVNAGAMPGVYRHSISSAIEYAAMAYEHGIRAIAIFPSIDDALKNATGSEGWRPQNLVSKAIYEIKSNLPQMGIIADIALDPYTSHGHDGIIGDNGDVDNDITIEALCRQALLFADAGCDILAPSDMMDGRISAIRSILENNGHPNVQILSYAAKYASNLYGPFRGAIGSNHNLRNNSKKTYQMDFANLKEALLEAKLDESEGADILMVKPAGWYLDVLRELSNRSDLPVFAYQVSGEYTMIRTAVDTGMLHEDSILESIIACKRSGARAIITYFALDCAIKLCN